MKDSDRARPNDDPFSIARFKATDVGRAAALSIEHHADEVIRIADLGLAPLTVLIPDLEALVCERLQWGMADAMIRDWLAPSFEVEGRVRAPTDLPHMALCYRRKTVNRGIGGSAAPSS